MMVKSIEDIKNFIEIAEEMLKRNQIRQNRLYVASENIAYLTNAIDNLFKTGKINKNFSGIYFERNQSISGICQINIQMKTIISQDCYGLRVRV